MPSPSCSGVTATIVVTVDADTYLTGHGIARTSHGALVPAGEAVGWGGGNPTLLAVALSRMRRVEAYSTGNRIFNQPQRLAIADEGRAELRPRMWCLIFARYGVAA